MAMGWVHAWIGLGKGWVGFKDRNIKIAAWFFFVSYRLPVVHSKLAKSVCTQDGIYRTSPTNGGSVQDYFLPCNSTAVTILCGLRTENWELVSLFHIILARHVEIGIVLFVRWSRHNLNWFVSYIYNRIVCADNVGWVGLGWIKKFGPMAISGRHSTDTAVIKVLGNILLVLDRGDFAALASVAFDTVDHATLIRRIQMSAGIRVWVLDWCTSYLSYCRVYVCSGTTHSRLSFVCCDQVYRSALCYDNSCFCYTCTRQTSSTLSNSISYFLVSVLMTHSWFLSPRADCVVVVYIVFAVALCCIIL